MAKAEGITKPGFEKVLDVFRSNLEKGVDKGGSFAAYYKGELVVNIWGGPRDMDQKKPWQRDTLSAFFSTTKGMSAICIGHLVDKGLLDYNEKISKYWPEFAQSGKEKVTLRQYLTHTAGLMNIDGEWQSRDIIDDFEGLEKRMVAQKPYWEPGTKCGYHAMTFAMYLDSLIRKVDPKKRTLSQYFQEEIAEPFGVEFYIGLPEQYEDRATHLHPLKDVEIDMETMMKQVEERLPNDEYCKKATEHHSPTDLKEIFDMNNPGNHQTPDGSGYGFGTAESVAKVYGILANGGEYDGKRLLTRETIKGLETPLFTDIDYYIGSVAARGHGTWLLTAVDNNDFKNPQHCFGHPGAGGQFGYGDTRYKVGWSYTSNFLHLDVSSIDVFDERLSSLYTTMYDCIREKEGLSGPREVYLDHGKYINDRDASEK